jgi:hypothetical protein
LGCLCKKQLQQTSFPAPFCLALHAGSRPRSIQGIKVDICLIASFLPLHCMMGSSTAHHVACLCSLAASLSSAQCLQSMSCVLAIHFFDPVPSCNRLHFAHFKKDFGLGIANVKVPRFGRCFSSIMT